MSLTSFCEIMIIDGGHAAVLNQVLQLRKLHWLTLWSTPHEVNPHRWRLHQMRWMGVGWMRIFRTLNPDCGPTSVPVCGRILMQNDLNRGPPNFYYASRKRPMNIKKASRLRPLQKWRIPTSELRTFCESLYIWNEWFIFFIRTVYHLKWRMNIKIKEKIKCKKISNGLLLDLRCCISSECCLFFFFPFSAFHYC